MSTINCNGVTINYRTVGKGEDVVFIHGLGANCAFWHLNVLLPLGRKYRVTVYDLRGHGYSTMPSSGYTSEDMADDLHHLINHLGIKKAHLIGHSLGGVIALHYAALYPERVSSIPHEYPNSKGFPAFPNIRNVRLNKLRLQFSRTPTVQDIRKNCDSFCH